MASSGQEAHCKQSSPSFPESCALVVVIKIMTVSLLHCGASDLLLHESTLTCQYNQSLFYHHYMFLNPVRWPIINPLLFIHESANLFFAVIGRKQ